MRSSRHLPLCAGPMLAALLTGCGSAGAGDLPPAAEPARAPVPTAPAAGRLLRVGSGPEGIVADPVSGRVAVGLSDPARIALIDGRRGRVLDRLALPASPRHLALGPGGDVVVPAEGAGRLVRLSLPDGRRLGDIAVGGSPHDATTAGRLVLVANQRDDTIGVLDGGRRVGAFPVAAQPGGLASVSDGRRVAVVSLRERVVELFDVAGRRRLARVAAGVGPTHLVSDSRFDRLYVTDTAGGALLVFDTQPQLELVRRVYLPGAPHGIAIDERRHRLWVTLTATNEVVELPAHGRPHVLRRFPTARQPDAVAVDEATGRLFVTGRHAGVVQLLDP